MQQGRSSSSQLPDAPAGVQGASRQQLALPPAVQGTDGISDAGMLSRWETSARMQALMPPQPQPDGPVSSSAWPFPPLPDDDQEALDEAVAQLQAVCDATAASDLSLPPLQDGSPEESDMPDQTSLKRVRETVGLVQKAKDDALEAIRILSETPERNQQK